MFANNKKFNPFCGITLIETVVALGILTFVISATFVFIIETMRTENFTLEQSEANSQAEKGVKIIASELREATLADTGAYPIEFADNDTITFYSDIDTNLDREKVTYIREGATLKKIVTKPTTTIPIEYPEADATEEIIINSIINELPIFTYYNGDYPFDTENNPLEVPVDTTSIKLVHIRLDINPRPQIVPNTFIVESDIQLRNMKDNLAQ